MAIADTFNNDIFNMQSLTTAINTLPFAPSRLGDLGVFAPQGIQTTVALIEEKDGTLELLPTQPRGAPSTLYTSPKRKVRSFPIPHIPHDDRITAEDVQSVRAFGSETQLQTVSQVVNDHLTEMRQDHEVTLEHLRVGAIKGSILDADGVTELFNLFTEFGVTQTTVDFFLGTTTTEVLLKCLEVKRAIELVLGAAPVTLGIRAMCSPEFFDAFTTHSSVDNAFQRFQDNNFFRTDNRTGFVFGGIQFEEYVGTVSGVSFIPPGDCRFFPVGVPRLFKTFFAPADFMETVNTIGRPMYAKQVMEQFERGVIIHTQSNPLPLCCKPGVLVRGFSSD